MRTFLFLFPRFSWFWICFSFEKSENLILHFNTELQKCDRATSKIFFKVFFGESTLPKEEQNDNPKNENDRQMLLPLFILTAPSVFLGLFIYDPLMIGILFQNSLAANELMMSFYNGYVINSFKFLLHSFTTINFLILLIGLIFSYLYYYKKASDIVLHKY